jgi:hypothetical protein
MSDFEKWYEKHNGPIDGWNDAMHEQEAAFNAGVNTADENLTKALYLAEGCISNQQWKQIARVARGKQ